MNNILDIFTLFSIPIKDAKEWLRNDFLGVGEDPDTYILAYGNEIENFENAEFVEFKLNEFYDFIKFSCGPYEKFLLVDYGNNWTGKKGYRLVDDYKKIFDFSFDFSIYRKYISDDLSVQLYRISSHDAPMGADYLVIGLEDYQYNILESFNFDKVMEFADKYYYEANKVFNEKGPEEILV